MNTGSNPPGTIKNDPHAELMLPGLFLIILGGINGLMALTLLLLTLTGAGVEAIQGYLPQALAGAATLLVNSLVGLGFAGFIIYGGLKMKRLENWIFCFLAAIIAIIPCTSPCCIIGMPVGLWAIMSLLSPEIKNAFRS